MNQGEVRIVRVPVPAPGEEPGPLHVALLGFQEAFDAEVNGHRDFAQPPGVWLQTMADRSETCWDYWLALPGGAGGPAGEVLDEAPGDNPGGAASSPEEAVRPEDVLGVGVLETWVKEDLDTAAALVRVRADARSRGIGRALAAVLLGEIERTGRTRVLAWPESGVDFGPEDAVRPACGMGAVDGRAAASRWLAKLGFTLQEVWDYLVLDLQERGGLLELPADVEGAVGGATAGGGVLAAGSDPRVLVEGPPDYEVLAFGGSLPAEFHEAMARLRGRMSVDSAPSVGFEEQVWDAERVASSEQQANAPGRCRVTAVARHSSGELVGYTHLTWLTDRPAGVNQGDTLVCAEHRGHRLGLRMKVAACLKLSELNPEAERIHTWNAASNEHMLAVNDALGFVRRSMLGSWVKALPGGGGDVSAAGAAR